LAAGQTRDWGQRKKGMNKGQEKDQNNAIQVTFLRGERDGQKLGEGGGATRPPQNGEMEIYERPSRRIDGDTYKTVGGKKGGRKSS